MIKFTLLSFCSLVLNTHLQGQQSKNFEFYNAELKGQVISNKQSIGNDSTLEALAVFFKDSACTNVAAILQHNPTIQELHVMNPPPHFFGMLSTLAPNLIQLFIKEYSNEKLVMPSLTKLEILDIKSSDLTVLDMSKSELPLLEILDVSAEKLSKWYSVSTLLSLGLIELNAPLLQVFPIDSMPNIVQFSYHCSFIELPTNLCVYGALMYISFENYGKIEVSKCLRKKLRDAVYSNISVYDKINGKLSFELHSSDYFKE
jgi:hypothetical protein